MAAPTLTLLNSTSLSTAESVTGFDQFDLLDADIKKEGNNSISGPFRADGVEGYYDAGGAPITAAGKTLRFWINTINIPYLQPESSGGFEVSIYDGSTTEYKVMFGSDTYFGGWYQLVIGCDLFTSLTLANVDRWGIRCNYHTAAKNIDNVWIDAIKYLDGYSMTGGTSGDEVTLATIDEADRGTTTLYGYGVITNVAGVFFSTGELQFGTGATTHWFEMDGDILVFEDKPVVAGLYSLSAVGTGTRINIINSVIASSGATDATRFVFDFSDTDLLACTITNNRIVRAAAVAFKSGQTVTNNIFDDCGSITHGGADMSDSKVSGYEGTDNTSALVYNETADPEGEMDNMVFEMGTALTHAIEFGTNSPLTINLKGQSYTGYSATTDVDNSVLHIKRTEGTVTINVLNDGDTPSYRTDGATVNIVNAVTITITAISASDTTVIVGARVLLEADTGGALPAREEVTSINRVTTTATVAHTAHGMADGDEVAIRGTSIEPEYRGIFTITYIDVDSYSYTVSGTPTTPATGTITATAVLINKDTIAGGIATESFNYQLGDQPVTGTARESTTSPFYKPGLLAGTIDGGGFSQTVALVPDE